MRRGGGRDKKLVCSISKTTFNNLKEIAVFGK